ncbi:MULTISPECIES: AAA family ATPase [Bacillota]|jgi:cytidylate kinase|uniref:Cytidylate kinase family protein n=2 Tax=Amedibacillus TaxID=2749846 RepID=A0A7G9GQ62_9FIRM|nr:MULTISPECIES: cytidylate kinase family protein [Bacillota]QNM12944.1 cytidylate kinase family protein [[Eubacterium] hominis]MCH4287528.1 cytidylate kinase-like family protein [Amedibacillus hominis]RGB48542.1 hypothetical protein DW271_20555 [Absiella sp. AM22-9]RGB52697.1 hypothetical protein DW120_19840 [Absiella sp. AM10-20]RGB62612.1 hypothetical protein DW113_18935 [Absiella sp. AM09-45]
MKKSLFMDSEYCSMGRWISAIVADALDMKFYEAKHLIQFADEEWLTEEYLRNFDLSLIGRNPDELKDDEEFQRVYQAISKAILIAIEQGPCIIHERAAAEVVKNKTEFLNVLLYNTNIEHKLPRINVDPLYDVSNATKEDKLKILYQEDEIRKNYHNAVCTSRWGDKKTYDICLDSDKLSREKCAEILIEALKDVSLDMETCKKIIAKVF